MFSRTPLARLGCAVLLSALVLGACGDDESTSDTVAPPPKFVMSYVAGDTENQFLEELFAQGLANPDGANLRISRLSPVADLGLLYDQLAADRIQIMPVYSQQLLTMLRAKTGKTGEAMPVTVAEQVTKINELLPKGLSMGSASTGEHKAAIACTAAIVDKNTLTDLSGLAKVASTLVLAAPAGFDTATPLGAATLKDTYGITFKSMVTVADEAAITATFKDKLADCVVIDNGSALLVKSSLSPLRDDKGLVPGNAVIPLFQIDVPEDVVAVIEQITERVTNRNLTSILSVVAGGMQPHVAAKSFLETAQPDPVVESSTPGTGSAPAGSSPAGSSPAGSSPAGSSPAATAPPATTPSATTPGTSG